MPRARRSLSGITGCRASTATTILTAATSYYYYRYYYYYRSYYYRYYYYYRLQGFYRALDNMALVCEQRGDEAAALRWRTRAPA